MKPGDPGATTERADAAVVCLTNEARANRGYAPLSANSQLTSAAQGHADEMARKGYFSHNSFDGSDFSSRITDAGYSWSAVAENIAMGQPTPFEVVAAWLGSTDHCENLLSPKYIDIGVGVAPSPNGTYWVQDFGRPRSTPDPGGSAPSCPTTMGRQPTSVPDTSTNAAAPDAPTATTSSVPTGTVRLVAVAQKRGAVAAKLTCPAANTSPCAVTAMLRKRGHGSKALSAKVSRRIAPGATVKLRLTSKAGRRAVRRAGSVKAEVYVRTTGAIVRVRLSLKRSGYGVG